MEKYKPWEQRGLIDLLDSEPMHDIAFSIAKTITKNLLEPKSVIGMYRIAIKSLMHTFMI